MAFTRRLFALLALLIPGHSLALPVERLRTPPGFQIALWARVDNARQLALGRFDANGGTVYVGSMRAGKVHAVRVDAAMRASGVIPVADGLQMPVGVAWRNGDLYISAVSRILRIADIDKRLEKPPAPTVVVDGLPTETHHGWKFIAFGPDGKLYVPVGAPCNVCDAGVPYATILRMNADGTARETVASGVRNSVGFDWHPGDGALWFTDNGRDWLGDDSPPDELNRAPRAGLHFGYPYCHGADIKDPEFGPRRACSEFAAPVQNLGAHVAGLGMRFYTGQQFPAEYRQQVFIAEHGSWNRSKKNGYRVSLVRLKDNKAVSYEAFVQGWLEGETAWGRPADVQPLPDGSLLIADDQAGAIYRVTWQGSGR